MYNKFDYRGDNDFILCLITTLIFILASLEAASLEAEIIEILSITEPQ